MENTIKIFDTTCRDGKQAPGNNHGPEDTVRIARQSALLGVSVFEAGFAAASELDFLSIQKVVREVPELVPCSLSRASVADVEASARALEGSRNDPCIHTFIATSDIHLKLKLKMSKDEALEKAVKAVECARSYSSNVQFSAEDATRTDFDYLKKVVREVILAGVRTVNLPDTVGYAMPGEVASMVQRIIDEVPEVRLYGVVISVHCHNDLGFATANTLAGVAAGARQVEGTINGIGERAGNTHLAEVVMALTARSDYYSVNHKMNTKEIGNASRLVSSIIGKPVSDTLPIVGENVFAHGAGIHQHGALADASVYEVMVPKDVGWDAQALPLSSQSGRHGLQKRLQILGYDLSDYMLLAVYKKFLAVAETKVLVDDDDLHCLMQ